MGLFPNFYENIDAQARPVWTEAGKILANSQEYKEGKIVAKPLPAAQRLYFSLFSSHVKSDRRNATYVMVQSASGFRHRLY